MVGTCFMNFTGNVSKNEFIVYNKKKIQRKKGKFFYGIW